MSNPKPIQKIILATVFSLLASIGAAFLVPAGALFLLLIGYGYLVNAQPTVAFLFLVLSAIAFVFGTGIVINLKLTKNLGRKYRFLSLFVYCGLLIGLIVIWLIFLPPKGSIGF